MCCGIRGHKYCGQRSEDKRHMSATCRPAMAVCGGGGGGLQVLLPIALFFAETCLQGCVVVVGQSARGQRWVYRAGRGGAIKAE